MVKNCEVCPFLESDDPLELAARITENAHWVSTLRYDNQTLLGTSVITARRHVEALHQLTDEEEASFVVIRNNLMRAQEAAFGAEVINVMCLLNNAFQARNPSPHVHHHLKPRYRTPVTFRGVTYSDPNFGFPIATREKVFTEIEPTRQIVAALKANLPR